MCQDQNDRNIASLGIFSQFAQEIHLRRFNATRSRIDAIPDAVDRLVDVIVPDALIDELADFFQQIFGRMVSLKFQTRSIVDCKRHSLFFKLSDRLRNRRSNTNFCHTVTKHSIDQGALAHTRLADDHNIQRVKIVVSFLNLILDHLRRLRCIVNIELSHFSFPPYL